MFTLSSLGRDHPLPHPQDDQAICTYEVAWSHNPQDPKACNALPCATLLVLPVFPRSKIQHPTSNIQFHGDESGSARGPKSKPGGGEAQSNVGPVAVEETSRTDTSPELADVLIKACATFNDVDGTLLDTISKPDASTLVSASTSRLHRP